jgi:hypothetical protein
MASEVFDVSVDNFGCLGRQFRRHARLVWPGRLAVPDMDDLYAWRGDCRGQHGRQLGGEQARPLFRRQHLDVHALRDPHRYLQPFRIQRKRTSTSSAPTSISAAAPDPNAGRRSTGRSSREGVARYRRDAGRQGPATKLRDRLESGSGHPRPGRHWERRGT